MALEQDTVGGGDVRWHRVADSASLHRAACERIVAAAHQAIAHRNRFELVLAGGNTPRAVYRMLRYIDTDWSRWHVYFGDERCLPTDDAERNSVMAALAWLDHVPIPAAQRHVPPAELGAEAAARAYADTLADVGEFDLVLLGLGEDGHTASLFPGHDWGTADTAPDMLAVTDAPKPPPQRISMSAARLSRTRAVLFLVDGEAKHPAVKRWHAEDDIPARAIRPRAGVDVLLETSLLA